jgi:hypothetical protein
VTSLLSVQTLRGTDAGGASEDVVLSHQAEAAQLAIQGSAGWEAATVLNHLRE